MIEPVQSELRQERRRKVAVWGVVLGGPALVVVVAMLLLVSVARKGALESQASATLKMLGNVIATYTSANDGGMPELVVLEETSVERAKRTGFWPFHDPRLPRRALPVFTPGMTAAAKRKLAEEHCDFWYCGEGLAKFNSAKGAPSVIVVYDKGGVRDRRVILLFDGHVSIFDGGSVELGELVQRNNELRRSMGLQLLPEDLMGPPMAVSASGSSPGAAEAP